jgi:hypothetical protein
MSRLLDELAVAEDLQKNQASTDRDAPEKKYRAEKIEAGILAGLKTRRHLTITFCHSNAAPSAKEEPAFPFVPANSRFLVAALLGMTKKVA